MVCKKKFAVLGLAMMLALSSVGCVGKEVNSIIEESDEAQDASEAVQDANEAVQDVNEAVEDVSVDSQSVSEDKAEESPDTQNEEKSVDEQIHEKYLEIRDALMGDWESEDKAYKLSVHYDNDNKLTHTLYHDGEVILEDIVKEDGYHYMTGRATIYRGNVYYSKHTSEGNMNVYMYLDGDKLILNNDGDWIRLNRASASEPYAGHSDLFVNVRMEIIGIWGGPPDSDHRVYFDNSCEKGTLALVYQYNWGTDDKGEYTYDEIRYKVEDIIPASDGGENAKGFDYVAITTDTDTGKTVEFPFSYDENSVTMLIDGNSVTMNSRYHGI